MEQINELFEKSMRTLELPEVLEMLSAEAVCQTAKQRASELRPAFAQYDIQRRLAETSAARKLIGIKGNPGFYDIKDVGGSLGRAELGGMLNTRELMDIAGVLRAARTVRAYSDGEAVGQTAIDHLFSSLRANRTFEERIATSIVAEDEIADAASAELASVRRHMRVTNSKIRETLQKIISSPTYAKVLQEAIITMRSDRYVVPVKTEFKNAVPGLVHDVSSSGATLFIEPMQCVQANNELRELAAKEKKEIERILMELSAEAAANADDISADFNVLVTLDVIFAKAKLSYKLNCSEPQVGRGGAMILRRARHPLLPVGGAVPIDVHIGQDFDTLVITGPNTGGKTVTLKTMGLLCLMAQCGLHIPAEDGSRVPVFEQVLADIGDEQSIEQSLSTFSSHMTNIVSILKQANDASLLLFDELGAGTDPVEGAALAIAIIEHARRLGARIAATTHYAELKIYATTTEGVQNASCEFDVETLRPTYRLLIGVPGKSNAFAISRRLGLSEQVIELAQSQLDSGSAELEQVLGQLEEERQHMERDRQEARRELISAARDAQSAQELKKRLEEEREKSTRTARHEAQRIIDEARGEAERVFDELSEMKKRDAKDIDRKRVNDARAELMRGLNVAEERLGEQRDAEEFSGPARPVKPGDRVEVVSVGARGDVIEVKDGVLTIQAGILKVTAKENEVRILEEDGSKKTAERVAQRAERELRSMGAKAEVDLRGMMTDEAVAVTEQFLDNAVMAKLTSVSIIHGKGTGALRAAVHACLKRYPHIKSYRLGRYGEGETGVTIVEL